ncbi:hypothetical protein DTO012A9_5762 [Penicillium roqueforti]|nr:hypothetical protein CBS147310_8272 [Penicillium roqueforti]KAI3242887.1 hypothetical protein DTO012A9_5762 [Penicillium roqueforti]
MRSLLNAGSETTAALLGAITFILLKNPRVMKKLKCIKSAILNTMAFDRIEDRLIITNIFGTAHGQFGNKIVLSATYMSNLRELVDRD